MPFENVRLTAEERERLKAMKIKNPYGSFLNITEGIDPIDITIDKSAGDWLAWCYTHHDAPFEEFTFMYGGVPVAVQAERGVELWKITRVDTDEKTLSDDSFRTALTEAFLTYGTRYGKYFGGIVWKI